MLPLALFLIVWITSARANLIRDVCLKLPEVFHMSTHHQTMRDYENCLYLLSNLSPDERTMFYKLIESKINAYLDDYKQKASYGKTIENHNGVDLDVWASELLRKYSPHPLGSDLGSRPSRSLERKVYPWGRGERVGRRARTDPGKGSPGGRGKTWLALAGTFSSGRLFKPQKVDKRSPPVTTVKNAGSSTVAAATVKQPQQSSSFYSRLFRHICNALSNLRKKANESEFPVKEPGVPLVDVFPPGEHTYDSKTLDAVDAIFGPGHSERRLRKREDDEEAEDEEGGAEETEDVVKVVENYGDSAPPEEDAEAAAEDDEEGGGRERFCFQEDKKSLMKIIHALFLVLLIGPIIVIIFMCFLTRQVMKQLQSQCNVQREVSSSTTPKRTKGWMSKRERN